MSLRRIFQSVIRLRPSVLTGYPNGYALDDTVSQKLTKNQMLGYFYRILYRYLLREILPFRRAEYLLFLYVDTETCLLALENLQMEAGE